jgi:hypothetical protein
MSITLTPYFNPKQITGCTLWMDAADSRSFTFSSGSNISQWNDKSGNGRNTATLVGTPVLSNTSINGVQSVYFNGSSGFYGPITNTGTTLTVFMVVTANVGINTSARAVDVGVISSQSSASFAMNGSTSLGFSRGASSSYSTIVNGTPYVYCCKFDGTNGTLFINGLTTGSSASTGAFNYANYGIGQQLTNTSAPWLGFIGEVIMYSGALIDFERTQVEGYLAWKWGLKGSIPYYQSGSFYPYFRFTSLPLSCIRYGNSIISYNGGYIFYTMPMNATGFTFYMWGGGGPGGSGGMPGGGGAYLTGQLAVIPGETVRIIVGRGGQYGIATQWSTMIDADGAGGGGGGLSGQGGQGGGRTAIQKFITGSWVEVVTAGGGGSAGGNAGTYGGNAYFTGTSQSAGTTYGQGRVPTGGSATTGGLNTFTANVGFPWDGTQFTGGFASNAFNVSPVTGPCGGGGGGGGYYGGGGGGRSGADTYGGGGGGSYYNATYVTAFSGSNGTSNVGVATNIPGYITGCGRGGAGGSTNNGSNGLVVISHNYTPTKKTAGQYISVTNGVTFRNGSSNVIIFSYPGGTLTVGKAIMATFLIVGGGGGGGEAGVQTGGGGAGGAVYVGTPTAIATGTYSAVVGGGGAVTVNGSNSSCFGYTGQGGGKGGSWIDGPGSSGGCGGGGSGEGGAGASGTQGFGGAGGRGQFTCGGGGGGMGQAGRQPDDGNPSSGGNGLQYSITGSNLYYAGGGAGGYNGASTGGLGGGGNKGVKGTDGLGGGGGGMGGAGGHGTVIISYVIS